MNIKQKALSILAGGAGLSQLLAGKVFAQDGDPATGEKLTDWFPDYGTFKTGTLWGVVGTIVEWMLILAGVVAVIFIIIGAYSYITAGGDSEKAGAGRTTLMNAVIGLVIIFIAYILILFVIGQFGVS